MHIRLCSKYLRIVYRYSSSFIKQTFTWHEAPYMKYLFHCLKYRYAHVAYHKNPLHLHYSDVIISTMAYQITSLTIIYSTVYSGTDQRKHQSSASLAFMRVIHRGPVNSPHKWPVTRKCFHLMTSSCCPTLPGVQDIYISYGYLIVYSTHIRIKILGYIFGKC